MPPRTRHTSSEKQALVTLWRASGQSLTAFAREHGLTTTTLARWREAFPEGPCFADVEVLPQAQPALVVELLGSGHRIHVGPGFDAAELRRLVEALC